MSSSKSQTTAIFLLLFSLILLIACTNKPICPSVRLPDSLTTATPLPAKPEKTNTAYAQWVSDLFYGDKANIAKLNQIKALQK